MIEPSTDLADLVCSILCASALVCLVWQFLGILLLIALIEPRPNED